MNITPVSYKAYNSKNQTINQNRKTPNFKAEPTIVATVGDSFRPHMRGLASMLQGCIETRLPGTKYVIFGDEKTGELLTRIPDMNARELDELTKELSVEFRTEGYSDCIIGFHAEPKEALLN